MHRASTVAEVLALGRAGHNACEIARRTGTPRRTVADWLAGKLPRSYVMHPSRASDTPRCRRCGGDAHAFATLPREYAYLLGIYLGDGCISEHRRGVHRLRISLDLRYPQVVEETRAAIGCVLPSNKVHVLRRRGSYAPRSEPSLVEVSAYSKQLACLFPQHGPGRKHQRRIRLSGWQRDLVRANPQGLIRGLIHSDGCRFVNTGRRWRHPRYAFSNLSDDIREIFCEACKLVGVHWTRANNTIYVSRKADVALLDTFVGPKR